VVGYRRFRGPCCLHIQSYDAVCHYTAKYGSSSHRHPLLPFFFYCPSTLFSPQLASTLLILLNFTLLLTLSLLLFFYFFLSVFSFFLFSSFSSFLFSSSLVSSLFFPSSSSISDSTNDTNKQTTPCRYHLLAVA